MAPFLKKSALEWLMFRRLAVEGKIDSYGSVIMPTQGVDDSKKTCTSYNQGVIYRGQDYIKMACSIAIKYQGRTAICQFLANSSRRDSLYQLLTTSDASVTAFHQDAASMVSLITSPGYDANASDQWLGPPMYAAVYNNNLGVARALLKLGYDPNVRGDAGTPIIIALWAGNWALLRLLCQCGRTNPNIPDKIGNTALWWACCLGFSDAVELLLEHKDTDPNIKGNGQSPLTAAVAGGHDAVVQVLLERGGLIVDLNNPADSPLWWAVYGKRVSTLRLLLEKLPVQPGGYDLNSMCLLWWAARYGHPPIVQMLLERPDVDPNRHDTYLSTPLCNAVNHGHTRAVWCLLQSTDLKPNRRSYSGDTPLMTAVYNEDETMVRLLLTCRRVSPNRRSLDCQSSPLTVAARGGLVSIVEALLERDDLRLDSQDYAGRTPLLWACRNGHDNVVRRLLNRQRSAIDIPDDKGVTCLIQAVWFNRVSVVRTLLEFNADRQSALYWAQEMRHHEVERMLLPQRCDESCAGGNG